MQTNLEKNAIKERKVETIKNKFGLNDEYDESKSKKGGEGQGSLVDHTQNFFDTSTGGGVMDEKGNPNVLYSGRLGNTVINTYREGHGYGMEVTVDTSLNEGQVVIF